MKRGEVRVMVERDGVDVEVTPLVPVGGNAGEIQEEVVLEVEKEGKISKLFSWTSVRILALIATWWDTGLGICD